MVRAASILLSAVLLAWSAEPVFTIHPEQVLRRGANRWLGIDLNYIRDADANRPAGSRPLTAALTDLGVRWLRYPGGEKSDFHRFAKPPYTHPEPLAMGWYATCAGQRMDFDAYIAVCRTVGAEPYVVVACESAANCGATWDEQLAHAVAWVRYANVDKRLGVRHWEIGNENWHNQTAPPAEMAAQVVRFARAMRAVDPTIRIGASGSDAAWWKVFLPLAARDLDFLSVSVYNCWNWRSYERILRPPEPDFRGPAGAAVQAIAALPDAADRDRLQVIVAETNSVDYSPDGWPRSNALGHAIATFEGLGSLLREPRVAAAMLWNTRWMDDAEAPGDQFYALAADNRLLPTGLAVALWGRHLRHDLVAIDGDGGDLRAHASVDADGGWTAWLVNRGHAAVAGVHLRLGRLAGARTVRRECLHGDGPEDPHPRLDPPEPLALADGSTAAIVCPPLSITVVTGDR